MIYLSKQQVQQSVGHESRASGGHEVPTAAGVNVGHKVTFSELPRLQLLELL